MRAARLLLPLSAALVLAMPAAADTIDVLRQNTLTLTQQDGKVMTILVKEGEELEQVNGAGVWAGSGSTWGGSGNCAKGSIITRTIRNHLIQVNPGRRMPGPEGSRVGPVRSG